MSTESARRYSRIERTTKESSVLVELDLDGTGIVDVSTTVPFWDHMLNALGTHARFDLTIRATGDTDVELTERTTSIKTLEWEHIHEALAASDFNISEAARRLGLHRRTLARKLEKRRVK